MFTKFKAKYAGMVCKDLTIYFIYEVLTIIIASALIGCSASVLGMLLYIFRAEVIQISHMMSMIAVFLCCAFVGIALVWVQIGIKKARDIVYFKVKSKQYAQK